jgi:hypothetical protein
VRAVLAADLARARVLLRGRRGAKVHEARWDTAARAARGLGSTNSGSSSKLTPSTAVKPKVSARMVILRC